jgi:group I intron endonuclease
MYSLYHIGIDPDLGTGYIGITKNVNQRFSQHGWQRQRSNRHLRFAIKKYGDQVFKRVVLSNLDKELAELCEEMLRPEPEIGWNITKGGGVPPNPKGKVRSAEYCANIAKAKIGDKNPMFGKKVTFSEEHRKKLSESAKGRKSLLCGVKRKIVECPHCHKLGGVGPMQLWHFDRCRDASI